MAAGPSLRTVRLEPVSRPAARRWKAATLVADTSWFGVVEVKATADGGGNVQTLAVTVKGKIITIPQEWLKTLPGLPLASIQLRRSWLVNGPRECHERRRERSRDVATHIVPRVADFRRRMWGTLDPGPTVSGGELLLSHVVAR